MLYSKNSELEMLKYLFKGEVPPSPRPLVSNSSWKVFCPFLVVAVFWQNCKSCQQWWLMKVFPPRNMSISEGKPLLLLSCSINAGIKKIPVQLRWGQGFVWTAFLDHAAFSTNRKRSLRSRPPKMFNFIGIEDNWYCQQLCNWHAS